MEGFWNRFRGFRGRSGRFQARSGPWNCNLEARIGAIGGWRAMFHEEIVAVEPLYFRDRVKKLKKPSEKRLTRVGRSD